MSRQFRSVGDPYTSMLEWIERDGNKYAAEPAESVAHRLPMADLMRAHSTATIRLCGPLHNNERELWEEALEAVCQEIGKRFEGLTARVDEHREAHFQAALESK